VKSSLKKEGGKIERKTEARQREGRKEIGFGILKSMY